MADAGNGIEANLNDEAQRRHEDVTPDLDDGWEGIDDDVGQLVDDGVVAAALAWRISLHRDAVHIAAERPR